MRRRSPRPFLFLSLLFSAFIIISVPLALAIKPYTPYLHYLLGLQTPTSYLFLLGNDTEMRANGGFVGSYAKLNLSFPNHKLEFQDIYVPNGQLKGYVTPPPPIQEAFQHGSWELANADWEPDFPTTANTLRWFLEKGNETNPDILVLLNLSTIKKVLDVVGSFPVPEYGADITPDNLYLFLQGKAEVGFFPGSTQKKDALTAVGVALKKSFLSLPLTKKIKLIQILHQDLTNQNILVHSNNPVFQSFLETQNFAGSLTSDTADTTLLIETNLGANKANAYITRHTVHDITKEKGQIKHTFTITLQNGSSEANPNPPFHYGGDYIAYLRLYLPQNAQGMKLEHQPLLGKNKGFKNGQISTASKFGFLELGFWQVTPAQNQSVISLSYTLPISSKDYSLTLLKQHGLTSSPQTVNFNGQILQTELKNDFILP